MKNQLRAIGDFWRQEYGRFVGMTAIAFLVLTVLAYIAGRLFPDIPVTVMSYFNDMIDSSGIVQEDGSFSVLALLGSNVRAMVLSALYGFIPFLYLPALSLGLNAAIIGMMAAMMQDMPLHAMSAYAGEAFSREAMEGLIAMLNQQQIQEN